jgi:hypothetical protein
MTAVKLRFDPAAPLGDDSSKDGSENKQARLRALFIDRCREATD